MTSSPVSESSEPVGSSANRTSGRGDEAAGERDALRLAAGQLARPALLEPVQAEALRTSPAPRQRLGAAGAAEQQRQRDVLLGGQLGNELAELEDETEPVAAQRAALGFAHACRRAGRRSAPRPRRGTRMPARQCSRVDLPDPLGPITARISPGVDGDARAAQRRGLRRTTSESRASRMRLRPWSDDRSSGRHRLHHLCQCVEPGGGQVDPAQVGLQVEQAVVGEQRVDQAAARLSSVSSRIRLQVRAALGVEVALGGPAEHQRQHHLGEQHRLQVRLGLDRLGEPRLDLGHALVGDHVALAVGPAARLGVAPTITLPSRASRASVA